jgi:DNA polymerase
MELFLQFQGGVGAFLTGASTYGFDIEQMAVNAWNTMPPGSLEKAQEMLEWRRKQHMTTYGLSEQGFLVCEAFKALWRSAHPATVQFWKDLKQAIYDAIAAPKTAVRVGRLAVQRDGTWLRIRLPSGRYLCYPGIEVHDDGGISYMGTHAITHQWTRIRTYEGKAAENLVQSVARDVLFHGVRLAEDDGYEIVMRVHDELICEVPDTPTWSEARLSQLMATNAPWAEGLPLAAAGFETYRYRKAD